MFASLDVSQRIWAPTRGVKLNELISNLTSEGKQAVLSGVLVKGDVKRQEICPAFPAPICPPCSISKG